MSFSISSVKREVDNPEDIVITDESLEILGNILEEKGVQIVEEAIEIAEKKNDSAVRGEEIRKAFFEN